MNALESNRIMLKRAMVLPNNILVCTYCNQLGHDNKDCWQYETEMVNLKKNKIVLKIFCKNLEYLKNIGKVKTH